MAAEDEAAIRGLIEARNAAVRAGDAERAAAPLSDGMVAYDLQPPLRFTGAAARDADGLARWLATWDGPVSVEMPAPTVVVHGDLAFAHGPSRMQGRKRGAPTPIDLWYRTTLCLKRAGGAWAIVHEHNSVPMRMGGSGLAAVDLEPDSGPRPS
ncbi:hypothetical protein GCM10009416_46670 [Craurococcus roseus]|uniref:SnoaL-like domain-containing protein n=1 Tax=Craurococcus roseus TaxID=77585 RepID=A0ABN1G459_9PROT